MLSPERTASGVERLLDAPRDLLECGIRACPRPGASTGVPAHRALFAEYAELVDVVAGEALVWWAETLAARGRDGLDPALVEREAWRARPAGPASFPGLVSLVRDYWLACDRLNAPLAEAQRVAPETLLLDWLRTSRHDDAERVLACMPYWPLGLDAAGAWI